MAHAAIRFSGRGLRKETYTLGHFTQAKGYQVRRMKDYKAIFEKVESTLISVGSANLYADKIRANLDEFKHLEGKVFSDADYYWILVYVVFYAGFRAATVNAKLNSIRQYFPDYETVAGYDESKVDEILSDPEMIRNRRRVQACIENAKVFKSIVSEHGSFQAYIDSFSPTVFV